MTQVINIRFAPKDWEKNDQYVYIGRTGHGHDGYYGNPIVIGKICPICGQIHKTGGSTLACFTIWFNRRILIDPEYRSRILSLKGKILVCFCKPNPCHGDIIAQWLINN